MKSKIHLATGLALSLLAHSSLRAQEGSPEITGLRTAAAEYLTAYNDRDAKAIAALFTEDGEITDLTGDDIIAGREAIQAHYEDRFSEDDLPLAAVEVASVRLVAPNLAIEDGTIHLTPTDSTLPNRSMKYTAALVKNDTGKWFIGSTRDLSDVTNASGQLAGLADDFIGDWSSKVGDTLIETTFEWDASGKFILGELLVTLLDSEPLSSTIRIGWDKARNTITWWNFDTQGGFAKGDWTRTESGWYVRTSGTTSSGETRTANQHITIDSPDSITWTSKDRMIDGEMLEDRKMTFARQPLETQDAAEPTAE